MEHPYYRHSQLVTGAGKCWRVSCLHLQGTTDAAFAVTEEGEILSWNKAAEKLLGYSAAEAIHKTCYDILEGMGALGTRVHWGQY